MNILKVLSGKAVAASYYYGVNENCRCKVCKMCTFRASKRQLPHLNIDGIKLTKIVFFFCYSYYASTAFPVGPGRIVPPLKRQRLMTSSTRNGKTNQIQKVMTVPPLEQLKVYSK